MSEIIVVGIGEYIIIEGNTKISTIGLGSCIGAAIYDDFKKIAGLSHIMLPTKSNKTDRIGKYADTAIPTMIKEMIKKGASRNRLKAKIAGGASLFSFKEDHLRIGERNIEAVKKVLNEYHIKLIAEDVGGYRGRTIIFDPGTAGLVIKMIKRGANEPMEKII